MKKLTLMFFLSFLLVQSPRALAVQAREVEGKAIFVAEINPPSAEDWKGFDWFAGFWYTVVDGKVVLPEPEDQISESDEEVVFIP